MDALDSLTAAERTLVMQKAMHDDSMRRTAAEVMDLRKSWEASKKVTAERKNAYDEALGELLLTAASGPPKPEAQMKLPFSDPEQTIESIGIPGEICDILREGGIETVIELGEIIDGDHDEFDSLAGVQGISETAAAIAIAKYRENQPTMNSESEEFSDDEDIEYGEAPMAESPKSIPIEREVEEIPQSARGRAIVKEQIDDCPFAKGATVDGEILEGDNFRAVGGGDEFLLQAGEFELVKS